MQRIHVSSNRRFLVTEDGKPFFWLGDTAWELFHRCTPEQVELYLENRRQKGFNVIQAVALAEEDGLNTPNALGDCPLIDNDPTKPNEAYFANVDFVIQRAAEKGLYIGLLPTWGDKIHLQRGRGPVVFNYENAYVYGEYLGRRYRNMPNIIWILGGDRSIYDHDTNTDYGIISRAMAYGIRAGVNGHTFMTFHPRGLTGSSEILHHENWLDLNMWQSGHSMQDKANWELISHDYNLIPTKPTLDGESCYEDHPINPFSRPWLPEYGYFRDYDVRKQAYRAVFAGACGHTYGHHSVWQMYAPPYPAKTYADRPWLEALDRPGATQMQFLKALIESRPYFTRIPDQNLLASDEGIGGNHVQATRSADGSYALIHIPNANQTIEVNMGRLSGATTAVWWYDPCDGTAHPAAAVTTRAIHSFTSPANGQDWVLVLDDVSKNFAVPGTKI
jgi:hypothetical protein